MTNIKERNGKTPALTGSIKIQQINNRKLLTIPLLGALRAGKLLGFRYRALGGADTLWTSTNKWLMTEGGFLTLYDSSLKSSALKTSMALCCKRLIRPYWFRNLPTSIFSCSRKRSFSRICSVYALRASWSVMYAPVWRMRKYLSVIHSRYNSNNHGTEKFVRIRESSDYWLCLESLTKISAVNLYRLIIFYRYIFIGIKSEQIITWSDFCDVCFCVNWLLFMFTSLLLLLLFLLLLLS